MIEFIGTGISLLILIVKAACGRKLGAVYARKSTTRIMIGNAFIEREFEEISVPSKTD